MTAQRQADKIKWLNSDRCIHFDVCYTRLRDNTVCYNEQNLPCCNYSCPLSSAIQQEREKVLSFLDELISDRVSDARKREIVESLRTQQEQP